MEAGFRRITWRPPTGFAKPRSGDTPKLSIGSRQMLAIGQGIRQDNTEAANWYRKAAEQGVVGAQYNLGTMYVFGQGVAKDYAEAVKWFRKAADQGYVEAQYNLGVSYRDGQGVAQDFHEALTWFRKGGGSGILRGAVHDRLDVFGRPGRSLAISRRR